MSIKLMPHGADLFESEADVLVNAVNCVGVMGGGIATSFKSAYPEMFDEYYRSCAQGYVEIGVGHWWYSPEEDIYVFNLPTMHYPGSKAQLRDIIAGLVDLRDWMSEEGHYSAAIPALGAGIGGLDFNLVREAVEGVFMGFGGTIELYQPLKGVVGSPSEVNGERVLVRRVQLPNEPRDDFPAPGMLVEYSELVGAWHILDPQGYSGVHWITTPEILRWDSFTDD